MKTCLRSPAGRARRGKRRGPRVGRRSTPAPRSPPIAYPALSPCDAFLLGSAMRPAGKDSHPSGWAAGRYGLMCRPVQKRCWAGPLKITFPDTNADCNDEDGPCWLGSTCPHSHERNEEQTGTEPYLVSLFRCWS